MSRVEMLAMSSAANVFLSEVEPMGPERLLSRALRSWSPTIVRDDELWVAAVGVVVGGRVLRLPLAFPFPFPFPFPQGGADRPLPLVIQSWKMCSARKAHISSG